MAKTFQKPSTGIVIGNQAKVMTKGIGLGLLKPKLFRPNVKIMGEEGVAFDGNAGTYGYDKKSLFGTPIYDIVTFEAISYTDENGSEINLAKFDLEVAIVEVNKPRNIVKTQVMGKNGTVKEYMSDDDYQITIYGSFTNKYAYRSPEELIRNFNNFTKVPLELKIVSNFLSYFDIFTIVIENSKIQQREGSRNIVDYELHCSSDTPFEIQSAEESNGRSSASTSFF